MVIKILRSKNLKTTDTPPSRDERALIFNILFNLSKNLPQKWTLLLEHLSAINEHGEMIAGNNLLSNQKLVPEPKHPSWIDYDKGRKLLFLKLDLKIKIDFPISSIYIKIKIMKHLCLSYFYSE